MTDPTPAFERAFRLLLRAEGGYVNDPNDAGGATNHGISLRAVRLRDVDRDGHLDFDLDRDGDVDRSALDDVPERDRPGGSFVGPCTRCWSRRTWTY